MALFVFLHDTATTEIYTLSLHDALPILVLCGVSAGINCWFEGSVTDSFGLELSALNDGLGFLPGSVCPHYDGEESRKSTRLNSSHPSISYAVFCLKKKNKHLLQYQ